MKLYNAYKYSGFEWIGEIPKNWRLSKFKYNNNISSSNIDKKENLNLQKFKIIHYNDVIRNQHIDKTTKLGFGYCSETQINNFSISLGDIILTKDSMDIRNICDSTIITGQLENAVYGYHLFKVSNNRNDILAKYNYYFFKSKKTKEYFLVNANGTTIIGVSLDTIKNTPQIIPPLKEQEQIVSYLDIKSKNIKLLIEQIKKKIELLKEKRLKLVEKILLNSNNKRIQLKHLVKLMNRPVYKENNKTYTKVGMYNWGRGIFKYTALRGSDLGDSSFNYLKEGDLLLSGQFSWEGSVSIVEKEENNCISSHRFHIINSKKNNFLNEFLWSYLTSQEGHHLLNENSPGSAGRNRPLNIIKLLNEKVPLPEMNLQNEIKKLVIETRKYEKYARNKIKFLNEYHQVLISSVVTGKLRVSKDMQ